MICAVLPKKQAAHSGLPCDEQALTGKNNVANRFRIPE
jgi:hypothetical protein